ncbi:MAG: hypothetical protein IPK87_05355 [Planctomycetes bacterium]|nr:hypothetical protein [Planctomycetota bacterium]
MRTLLVSIALLVAAAAASIAQDAPKPPEPTPIRVMELYKVKGRAWSHRITEWHRGGKPGFTNEKGSITESDGKTASYRVRHTSEDGNSSGGGSGSVDISAPKDSDKAWADEKLPQETLEMAGRVWVCRKHTNKIDGIEINTWVSAEWHPLIVKQVHLGAGYCQIRKLTSFDSAERDMWSLYRVVGRSWLQRMEVSVGGNEPMVSYSRSTVKAVTADGATVTNAMLDKDKKAMPGAAAADMKIEFKDLEAEADVPAPVGRENKTCEAGDFDCEVFEVGGAKYWNSAIWPSLIVFYDTGTVKTELVELDLGHDPQRLYRTAGNYYLQKSSTSFGGMQMEQQNRLEVSEVKDGKSTFTTISYDQQGNEQFRNDSEMAIAESEGPRMPYTGQIEEGVTTPAGSFRCIKTEHEGGITMWMHHGIVIKLVMETKDMSMMQEVIELKLE